MTDKRISSDPRQSAILDDASKGPGLLFGTLLILCIFGVAESIAMFWKGRPAGLVELLIFALLAADAIILLHAVLQPTQRNLDWLGLLSVWVLGLIPYFLWVVIYGGGKGLAALVQRRWGHPSLIALLLLMGVLILCSCAYWFASNLATRP